MNPPTETRRCWIAVLIKDFATAKSRLGGAMSAQRRLQLARSTALRALVAARAVAPTLAVCGSAGAAELAARQSVEVVEEERPQGQNEAARRGLDAAVRRGADEVLLLSSDLPLVDAEALRAMLHRGPHIRGPLVVAAAALGRSGTNALLLRPPEGVALHFGDASLPRFAEEAVRSGRTFVVHEDVRLGLDLDEPSDLETLRRLRGAA